MQPRPTMDLTLRELADEMQPPDLRPLLHPDHLGPPELAPRKRTQAPQTTGQPLQWPTIHPAQVDQFHPALTP
jgi:hypothetical protein